MTERDAEAVGEAHPRSRGENLRYSDWKFTRPGSSPLTRGKHGRGLAGVGGEGLIPAHAGKTLGSLRCRGARPAHPRSRGENLVLPPMPATSLGSSPLTRGKRQRRRCGRRRGGLIPAHAGKTLSRFARRPSTAAHPRSRGENSMSIYTTIRTQGSSPLTRGKHAHRVGGALVLRLIPAHAGKTLPDLRFYCADRSDLGNP